LQVYVFHLSSKNLLPISEGKSDWCLALPSHELRIGHIDKQWDGQLINYPSRIANLVANSCNFLLLSSHTPSSTPSIMGHVHLLCSVSETFITHVPQRARVYTRGP
jgi:hypothetical protein